MHLTAPLYCGNIGYKGVDSLSDVICQTSIIANNKINIKELADMLQVSPAAVSLALSGKGNLSHKLRSRITSVAKDLGYSPGLQARALRKSDIKIAVVLPAFPAYICNKFKNGIREAVNEFFGGKLECTIYEYETSDDHAYAALQDIIKSNYDGAILALDDMSEERCFFDIYEQFNALKIPVISMGNKTKLFSACCTAWVDARRGGAIAADMFHLMGCDEVLVLSGSMYSSIHQRYTNGFAAAVKGYGMKISDIGYTEGQPEITARATAERFPARARKPGVFLTTCYSWAVCDALQKMGVSAPVIGMDLLPQTEEYLRSGQLTATLCQHQTMLAKSAANALIDMILTDSGAPQVDDLIFEPYIITKGSIAKPVY